MNSSAYCAVCNTDFELLQRDRLPNGAVKAVFMHKCPEPKKAFVCSPFRAYKHSYQGRPLPGQRRHLHVTEADNVALARFTCKALHDAGDAPFAPHLLYPQYYTDVGRERVAAIRAGKAFLACCDYVHVVNYTPGHLRRYASRDRLRQ